MKYISASSYEPGIQQVYCWSFNFYLIIIYFLDHDHLYPHTHKDEDFHRPSDHKKLNCCSLLNCSCRHFSFWDFALFYLLFGCPTTNFGPMSMGQPHQSNVNYCVYLGWVPKPGRAPSGVRTGNLPILNETPYPTTLFFPDFFLMLYYGTRHGELKINKEFFVSGSESIQIQIWNCKI